MQGQTKEKALSNPWRTDRGVGVLIDMQSGGRPLIPFADVPLYMDEAFEDAVSLWSMFKHFGLPNGGGPLHERPRVIQAITIVEEEKSLWESREMERRRTQHGTR